jgi:hypothetical protein
MPVSAEIPFRSDALDPLGALALVRWPGSQGMRNLVSRSLGADLSSRTSSMWPGSSRGMAIPTGRGPMPRPSSTRQLCGSCSTPAAHSWAKPSARPSRQRRGTAGGAACQRTIILPRFPSCALLPCVLGCRWASGNTPRCLEVSGSTSVIGSWHHRFNDLRPSPGWTHCPLFLGDSGAQPPFHTPWCSWGMTL